MAALIAFAPFLINLGNLLINMFVSDQAQRNQFQKDFLEAITKHANDALTSVNQRIAEQKQRDDLAKKAADLDNPPPPPKGAA